MKTMVKMIEKNDKAAKDQFGIDKQDIKNEIEKNYCEHLVVLCHDFKDAMDQVLNYSDSFDLFIVDRNLRIYRWQR